MLYSGMLPETTVADREARPPSLALSAAAAGLGTPVYVIDMAAAAARLKGIFGRSWLRLYSLKANDRPAVTKESLP